MKLLLVSAIAILMLPILPLSVHSQPQLRPAETEAIAEAAYIYAFPMVMNYKVMYEYAVNRASGQFKAPFNQIFNETRVFTPADTSFVTPNSDTPYSFLWADLRAEPLVLGVPQVDQNRYYCLQFVDLYTYNFAYVGSVTTGNGEGKFLLAGPNWKGKTPKGIKKVIRADTDFVLVFYRTQLFNPEDIGNVKKVQAGYSVEPLSRFLGTAAPAASPKVDWPPYRPEKVKSLAFFDYLSFILRFCPAVPGDKTARANFAKIGIAPGQAIDWDALSAERRKALEAGMSGGQKAIEAKAAMAKSAADLFGTRKFLKNNYLNRAVGARLGIYGNSREEAFYFRLKTADGSVMNGAGNNCYMLRFAKGKLPPVKAFWSLTMYDARTNLLIANPINRSLINSSMLPNLKLDAEGGLRIYIQKDSPGKGMESNWLPAPDGPFYLVLRCYWPKKAILNGSWEAPPVARIKWQWRKEANNRVPWHFPKVVTNKLDLKAKMTLL